MSYNRPPFDGRRDPNRSYSQEGSNRDYKSSSYDYSRDRYFLFNSRYPKYDKPSYNKYERSYKHSDYKDSYNSSQDYHKYDRSASQFSNDKRDYSYRPSSSYNNRYRYSQERDDGQEYKEESSEYKPFFKSSYRAGRTSFDKNNEDKHSSSTSTSFRPYKTTYFKGKSDFRPYNKPSYRPEYKQDHRTDYDHWRSSRSNETDRMYNYETKRYQPEDRDFQRPEYKETTRHRMYSNTSDNYFENEEYSSSFKKQKTEDDPKVEFQSSGVERHHSKSLISSKRERMISTTSQDDLDLKANISMEQSAEEEAASNEEELIDLEISHYEQLLARLKDDANVENVQVKVEEPLFQRIYKENRQLVAKNHRFKLSLATTERPHKYSEKIYPNVASFECYQLNIQVHSTLRPRIAQVLHAQRLELQEKISDLTLEYKEIYEAWKREADKLDQKIQSTLVKTPTPTVQTPVDTTSRSGRRNPFASDAVRSEAEWLAVLASLGIAEQTEDMSRYAQVPDMAIDQFERRALQYQCNDHLVEDFSAELTHLHAFIPMKWSADDRELFKSKLGQYGKNFFKIASFFPTKSTSDCVQYYYTEKMRLYFKSYLKRCAKLKRRNNLLKPEITVKEEEEESVTDPEEPVQISTIVHDQEPVIVDQASPKEKQVNRKKKPTSKVLKPDDKVRIIEALYQHGVDFEAISRQVGNKTIAECQSFYEEYRDKLRLDEVTLVAKLEKHLAQGKPIQSQDLELLGNLVEIYQQTVPEDDGSVTADEDARSRAKTEEIDPIEPDEEELKKKKTFKKSPFVATEESFDSQANAARRTVSYWSVAEKAEFLKALAKYGKDWDKITKAIGSKSHIQNRNYYHNFRQKLNLDKILLDNGHSIDDDKNEESADREPERERKEPRNKKLAMFPATEEGQNSEHYRRSDDIHGYPPYPRPYMYAHPYAGPHMYRDYPYPPPPTEGYAPFPIMQPYLHPGPNATGYFRPNGPAPLPPYPLNGPPLAYPAMSRYFRPGMMPPQHPHPPPETSVTPPINPQSPKPTDNSESEYPAVKIEHPKPTDTAKQNVSIAELVSPVNEELPSQRQYSPRALKEPKSPENK